MTDINKIFELHELACADVNNYPKRRFIFNKLTPVKGKSFIGIVGPRGVGKTILLKQLAAKYKNSCYLSLDAYDEDIDLFNLIKELSENYKIKYFFLDEIHFINNYSKALKNIFDFLSVKLFFSSSVSISIIDSAYDLSRRVKLHYLYPFSFREYVFFKTGARLPVLTLKKISEKKIPAKIFKYSYLFDKYLSGELMPFTLDEPNYFPLLKNILAKIIEKDIPSVASINLNELNKIKKLTAFVGKSEIDGLNYSSLSKNIGITKYKAELYTNLLQKAFVLNSIFPAGTNVLREPKILMFLPYRLLFKNIEDCVGGLREDFFCETMRAAGLQFNYLKSTRGAKTPDYCIIRNKGKIIVEIGGKGKGREQFKGLKEKKALIFSHSNKMTGIKRPLFLLGFLT